MDLNSLEKLAEDTLGPIVLPIITEKVDELFGITPAEALVNLKESYSEHPEQDADWHVEDATGKFVHEDRMGELNVPGFVKEGVDALKPVILYLAKPVVVAVAQQAGYTPTA